MCTLDWEALSVEQAACFACGCSMPSHESYAPSCPSHWTPLSLTLSLHSFHVAWFLRLISSPPLCAPRYCDVCIALWSWPSILVLDKLTWALVQRSHHHLLLLVQAGIFWVYILHSFFMVDFFIFFFHFLLWTLFYFDFVIMSDAFFIIFFFLLFYVVLWPACSLFYFVTITMLIPFFFFFLLHTHIPIYFLLLTIMTELFGVQNIVWFVVTSCKFQCLNRFLRNDLNLSTRRFYFNKLDPYF